MMTCFLKKALPFILTLMVGTALGSVFGLRSSEKRPERTRVFTLRSETRGGGDGVVVFPNRCHNRRSTSMHVDFKPQPTYTEAARKDGFTGVARLFVEFRQDGTIGEVTALNELPYDLMPEAIEAARGIKFTPSTINGQPVSTSEAVEFRFGEQSQTVFEQ